MADDEPPSEAICFSIRLVCGIIRQSQSIRREAPLFDIIAFDADDTLWHNEPYYIEARHQLERLLAPYCPPEQVERRLLEIETGNVSLYGYGIKSYTLSMVEAAIELSAGRVSGREVQQVLELGKQMLRASVRLMDGAEAVLAELRQEYELMLITKGDLLEQGDKIERSGLAGYFRRIEIVREKNAHGYRELLESHAIRPERFLMVGNSLKSDILPVVEIGGKAVYIPYEHTWAHERLEGDVDRAGYEQIARLSELPALLARLKQQSKSAGP